MSPFDIARLINEKTMDDHDEVVENYNPYIINRIYSNMFDTLYFAEMMSTMSHLPIDMQLDFYYSAIPKGKRYGKWNSADKSELELINKIVSILNVNSTVAKRYLALLSEEDKNALLKYEGGK